MASRNVLRILTPLLALVSLTSPATAQARRAVTFLATGDPQFENDPAASEARTLKRQVQLAVMKQLTTRVTFGGTRGIVVAGDLTQNARKDEFEAYEASIRSVADRVYDGLGNHDMEGGNCCAGLAHSGYCTCPARMASAVASRRRQTTPQKVEGNHYSWNWDDVHFVQLNLYPADGPGIKTYFPANALSFLKRDLAESVGSSGRPVVLVHHYSVEPFSIVGQRTDKDPYGWTRDEVAKYWDAIADYNVILIVTGHLHYHGWDVLDPEAFWYKSWGKPPGATRDRTRSVPRLTARTINGKAVQVVNNDWLLRRSSSVAGPDSVFYANLVEQAPASFDLSSQGMTQLAGLPPVVKTAVLGTAQTIPVVIAGGAFAYRDTTTNEAWGYFVQVDITSDDISISRNRVSTTSPTPRTVERIVLPFVARSTPVTINPVSGTRTRLGTVAWAQPSSTANSLPILGTGASGNEGSGQPIFACRGAHAGGTHLGKLVSDRRCHIGYGGKVVKLDYFDLITIDGGVWGVPTDTMNALAAGMENGKAIRLCRAEYSGGVHPGKLISGKCNIAFGDGEIEGDRFEVLYRAGAGAPPPLGPRTQPPPPPSRIRVGTFGFWEVWSRQKRIASFAGAVGRDRDGLPLFACRFVHQGGVHPGKVRPDINDNRCYIGYGDKAVASDNYDLFYLEKGTWRPLTDPNTAMPAGEEGSRRLLLCRASYNGIHPGKVVDGKCNIAYGDREVVLSTFEVLYP